ncbi:MAG: hypothetical protein ACI9J2_001688 [Saprospiraceae bacterium]
MNVPLCPNEEMALMAVAMNGFDKGFVCLRLVRYLLLRFVLLASNKVAFMSDDGPCASYVFIR